MRFIIKNFGPTRNADITLKDFTVFIGPGGTGKSYIAYLIWMLMKMHPNWDVLVEEILNSSEFKKVVKFIKREDKIPRELSNKLLVRALQAAEKAHNETIGEYLSDTFRVDSIKKLIYNNEKKALIKICNDKGTKKLKLEINRNKAKISGFADLFIKDYYITYSRRKLSLVRGNKQIESMTFHPKIEEQEIASELMEILAEFLVETLTSALDDFYTAFDSYILTDSKSGLLRIAPSLIRATVTSRKLRELPISLPDREMLSELVLDKLKRKSLPLNNIADFLEENLGGKIKLRTRGSLFPEIYFKTEKYKVPILRSQSGVRELTPLIIYLRYVMNEGSLIVIEEPETHLHPYMQSIVTRSLAWLSQYVDVLITTHSPLILEELDKLIKLSKLSPEKKKEFDYMEFEGIKHDSIGIYRFKIDGTVERVKITEEGIYEEEFSSIYKELYNKYAKVEEYFWEIS